MININNIDELDNFIITNTDLDNKILLYFGASWCKPCENLKARLNDIETKVSMPLLAVCYIDYDENEDMVNMYNISSLPTQIFIKLQNNKVKEISRIVGYNFIKLKCEYDLLCY
jgi:thiol-disulfide isomerase/thioredoxin